MRLLIKKLTTTNFGIFIRNLINFNPIHMSIRGLECATVSDSFAWRTDNNFVTKFKYSDILDIFYKIKNSWVEIHFYNMDNVLVKIKKVYNLNISNEINISKKFLGGIEGYGTFYIYHFTNEKIDQKNIIANRCYLGYSQNKNLFSFMHGNTLAQFKKISNEYIDDKDIIKTSFFKNHTYKIQKFFEGFDKNELFFSNPTTKLIKFDINGEEYKLNSKCSKLIDVSSKKIILIKSNCLFFRPVVFSYKDNYLDVHHT